MRARLGPDPLRSDADPDRAWARISRSRAPLATLLMDQSVLAGVGNVYRAELLFRHRSGPAAAGPRAGQVAVGPVVGRPGCAAARRGAPGQDRDVAPGARSAAARAGRPRRDVRPQGLRLPAHRPPLPGLRHADRARSAPGPQPVLVPHLPARRGLTPRRTPDSQTGFPASRTGAPMSRRIAGDPGGVTRVGSGACVPRRGRRVAQTARCPGRRYGVCAVTRTVCPAAGPVCGA